MNTVRRSRLINEDFPFSLEGSPYPSRADEREGEAGDDGLGLGDGEEDGEVVEEGEGDSEKEEERSSIKTTGSGILEEGEALHRQARCKTNNADQRDHMDGKGRRLEDKYDRSVRTGVLLRRPSPPPPPQRFDYPSAMKDKITPSTWQPFPFGQDQFIRRIMQLAIAERSSIRKEMLSAAKAADDTDITYGGSGSGIALGVGGAGGGGTAERPLTSHVRLTPVVEIPTARPETKGKKSRKKGAGSIPVMRRPRSTSRSADASPLSRPGSGSPIIAHIGGSLLPRREQQQQRSGSGRKVKTRLSSDSKSSKALELTLPAI